MISRRIGFFNHKGGVSKTTTVFNVGWKLAEKGKKVILVDADPQCNLTGMALGYEGESEFEEFYEKFNNRNLMSSLAPAFESKPELIQPLDCVEVPSRSGMFIMPGHLNLSEYEVTLGISQELSGSLQPLHNLPGSFSYLLDITARKYGAEYLLIDMNPSLSSINQNLLMTSDYFIVPTSPDYFSVMAIDSLSKVIPKWHAWAIKAAKSETLSAPPYPFTYKTPKFLGTIIQKYRPRSGGPSQAFQVWIDKIQASVKSKLLPPLRASSMLLPSEMYAAQGLDESRTLAMIPDFNSLIATSQKYKTPIYSLTTEQLNLLGVVQERTVESQKEFNTIFSNLTDKVVGLTHVESA